MIGLIVKNFIIIGAIGGVVFASQSAYFRPAVESLYDSGIISDNSFTAKSNEWIKNNVYPKMGMKKVQAEKEVVRSQTARRASPSGAGKLLKTRLPYKSAL